MDPSVLGTGSLVLARAASTIRKLQGRMPLPPGWAHGGYTLAGGTGCMISGARVDPRWLFLMLQWAPPATSGADLPLFFTYKSDASNPTELGYNWSAPYHRWTGVNSQTIPPSAIIFTPGVIYNYTGLTSSTYSTMAPGQNTLVGNSTTGWVETQPDGTTYNYAASGVLTSVANKAGNRWTLSWDSGFNLVHSIIGPLGRRTSFAYNSSSYMTRIQDPGGRITSVTVNASGDLARITSPQLCITTLIYDGSHHLVGWVNPLGDRTSFTYASGTSSVSAVEQPLGQQTKYSAPSLAIIATRAFGDPRGGRTTIMYGSLGAARTTRRPTRLGMARRTNGTGRFRSKSAPSRTPGVC